MKNNVLIGFINEDNKDLISLKLGIDSICYLDQNRQIDFFDKANEGDNEITWTSFLKTLQK